MTKDEYMAVVDESLARGGEGVFPAFIPKIRKVIENGYDSGLLEGQKVTDQYVLAYWEARGRANQEARPAKDAVDQYITSLGLPREQGGELRDLVEKALDTFYDQGYQNGQAASVDAARQEAYEEGYRDGRASGLEDGRAEGHRAGAGAVYDRLAGLGYPV